MFDIILKECFKGVVTLFCYFVLMSSNSSPSLPPPLLHLLLLLLLIIYVSRGLINYNPTFLVWAFHNGSW